MNNKGSDCVGAMRSEDQEKRDRLEGTAYRELRLLEEVEDSPHVSQRHLALRLGIALGVANLLLRNLVRKGYIRASKVTWKRWVYVLTPAGIARKANLTFSYIERFRDHYRRVRTLVRDDLGSLAMIADSRIAIYGATELAELMYLALKDMGLTAIDVFGEEGADGRFLGMQVKSLSDIAPDDYAKVMVAFSTDVDARCRELMSRGIPPGQIFTLLQNSNHQIGAVAEAEDQG